MKKIKIALIVLFCLFSISCSDFLNNNFGFSDYQFEGKISNDAVTYKGSYITGYLEVTCNGSEVFSKDLLEENINYDLISILRISNFDEIGDYAFEKFHNLKKIEISSENQIQINKGIFRGIKNTIEFVISEGTTVNLHDDFGEGYLGFSYYIDETNSVLHIIGSKMPDYHLIDKVDYDSETGDKYIFAVVNTPWANFEGEIIVHEGIKRIGNFGLSGWNGTGLQATQIKLPETLEYIGDYAFSFCVNVSQLYIPGNVTYLGRDIFYSFGEEQKIILGWTKEEAFEKDLSRIYEKVWSYSYDGINKIWFVDAPDCQVYFLDGEVANEFYHEYYVKKYGL